MASNATFLGMTLVLRLLEKTTIFADGLHITCTNKMQKCDQQIKYSKFDTNALFHLLFFAMRYKNQPLSPEKKHQQNCPTKKPIIWVNYNDLTVLPHWKSWFRCGKSSPFMATPFRLVKYDNLPRYIGNSNPN